MCIGVHLDVCADMDKDMRPGIQLKENLDSHQLLALLVLAKEYLSVCMRTCVHACVPLYVRVYARARAHACITSWSACLLVDIVSSNRHVYRHVYRHTRLGGGIRGSLMRVQGIPLTKCGGNL